MFPDPRLRRASKTTTTWIDLGMPVIFSRACEYAIRGLIEMARHPGQENWKIQDLAERTNAPARISPRHFKLW